MHNPLSGEAVFLLFFSNPVILPGWGAGSPMHENRHEITGESFEGSG